MCLSCGTDGSHAQMELLRRYLLELEDRLERDPEDQPAAAELQKARELYSHLAETA